MLDEKRTEIAGQANKLRNGLSKIESTRAAVEDMSVELEIASQKVVEFQRQCDEYLVVIIQQSNEADEQRVRDTYYMKNITSNTFLKDNSIDRHK